MKRIVLLCCMLSLISTAGGCIYIPLRETANVEVDPRRVCGSDRPLHAGLSRDRVHELLGTPDTVCTSPKRPYVEESYIIANSVDYFYLLADSLIGSRTFIKKYEVVVDYYDGSVVSRCKVRAK